MEYEPGSIGAELNRLRREVDAVIASLQRGGWIERLAAPFLRRRLTRRLDRMESMIATERDRVLRQWGYIPGGSFSMDGDGLHLGPLPFDVDIEDLYAAEEQ